MFFFIMFAGYLLVNRILYSALHSFPCIYLFSFQQTTVEYVFAARFIEVLALNWQRARLITDKMDEKIPTTHTIIKNCATVQCISERRGYISLVRYHMCKFQMDKYTICIYTCTICINVWKQKQIDRLRRGYSDWWWWSRMHICK